MKSIKNTFCGEKFFIILVLILSLSFVIFQHAKTSSWDFEAYVLNAQYWFHNGFYFEILRPPLMPFIIGIISLVFPLKFSEFIFVSLIFIMFFFTTLKLAEILNFDKLLFLVMVINPYLLLFGLLNGTELLSLTFLELFILTLLIDSPLSGFFIGLASLSRYTAIIFLPLLLFHRKLNKLLNSLGLFILTLMPWFIYNRLIFGNFFTSIADSYGNNILFRQYLFQPINFLHFLLTANILFPFFILGLVLSFFSKNFVQNPASQKSNITSSTKSLAKWIFFIFFVFALYSYIRIPVKLVRYLFFLTLPLSYFAYLGTAFLLTYGTKKPKRSFVLFSLILFTFNLAISVYVLLNFFSDSLNAQIEDSINLLHEMSVDNCSLMSNAWVPLNYLGKASKPSPRKELVNYSIEKGELLLIFTSISEPAYSKNLSFLESFPILRQKEGYLLIGRGCIPQTRIIYNYLEELNETLNLLYNETLNIDACNILFRESYSLKEICEFINLKNL